MSKFIKSEFGEGEFATYGGKFVARFKRGGRGSFLTFLCKNFEVEEYFTLLDAGEAPLKILQTKGYVLPHIQKILKEFNYPVTVEGYNKMLDDKIAGRIQI